MPTKTCLFDLGNVLVTFSHEQMCEQIGQLVDRSADRVREALMDSGLQVEFESGRCSIGELHQRVTSVLGSGCDQADFEHALSAIFELNPGMDTLVRDLKESGVRLVLLSNTCRSHFEYVRRTYSILEPFDDFVLSCEVGAMKPAPQIYKAALGKIRCEPEECFYTDDIAEYVYAAQDFRIDAEVFRDPSTTRHQLASRGLLSQ